MSGQRVVAIGLDGVELTLAERLMADGEMPALAELRRRAARFVLDHGPAQRTGLAWEHVASGRSPESARRWAAVEFDPATYQAWQEGARFAPWWTQLDRRVVVFDTPYVDLRRAPKTQGIVAWGAHDPGAISASRPRRLFAEFIRRFGEYPSEWTYGTPWPSPSRTREMGEALSRALETRARAARWLATERLPGWDLFMAVAGEVHGAVEGLWHGIDPGHPLHKHASAPEAARGLIAVHRALDRMVGELVRSAGDAAVMAFTMGGMGANHSDVQSMVLLPELLFRHAFGRPLLTVPAAWALTPGQVPILGEDESWGAASDTWLRIARPKRGVIHETLRSMVTSRPMLKAGLKGARAAVSTWRSASAPTPVRQLHWQPARRYGVYWPRMPAFALPSFYDGRIRINLKGRERDGIVEPSRYEETCRSLETLLGECSNPLTGEPAVTSIERAWTRDPLALAPSESDLIVVWRDVTTALQHPRLGLIGPVPLRRTGGHTGRYGMAYVAAPGISGGDRGIRSSFDVVPTIVQLLGCRPLEGVSGAALQGVTPGGTLLHT
jgi:predicted AlkP superfamily phosphohydrolase/phosphomutase